MIYFKFFFNIRGSREINLRRYRERQNLKVFILSFKFRNREIGGEKIKLKEHL